MADQKAALCPYCLARSEPALRYSDRRMTACPSCEAWFVWPPPTAADLVRRYEAKNAGMSHEARARRANTTQGKWYEFLARTVAERVPGSAAGVRAVADVGAGALELSVRLARQFPRAHVEALDLFADGFHQSIPMDVKDRIACHRIDLNQLDLEPPPQRRFEVVTSVALIEHILDPLVLLRFLRSMTVPGGLIYLIGPEVTSAAHRLLRRHWPYYCPDEHLTIPSLASIEKAVAHAGGGAYQLRRLNVHYSLKYLMRYLRVPFPVPAAADVVLPVPAGAFELVWPQSVV